MASRVCQLCRDLVEAERAINLFSAVRNWGSQITALLDVIVSRDDGLSSYICMKCKLQIVSLEKSVADLEAFKQLLTT